MFRKLSSAVTSRIASPSPSLPASHHAPSRAEAYVDLASRLAEAGVPVDTSDCATCDQSSPPETDDALVWGGKSYEDYVLDRYGDLGALPMGFDTDWESELPGSAQGGQGRAVVISTGKSDWERDHTVSQPPLRRLQSD